MKRLFIFLFVAAVSAIFGLDSFAAGKKVAVFVEGNLTKAQKTMVNNSVMSRLSGNKEYKVFERNDAFLKALEREHDYELSGECSENQIRKIGEKMGVDYVIAVCAVLTDDDQCQMSARMIDLESGEVLKTCNASREFEDSSTITALANNVAYRLISKKSK